MVADATDCAGTWCPGGRGSLSPLDGEWREGGSSRCSLSAQASLSPQLPRVRAAKYAGHLNFTTLSSMATRTASPRPSNSPQSGGNALDRFFSITARGSSIAQEIRGGVVTFFTMAYIVVLNPLIIGTQADATGTFLGGGTVPHAMTLVAAMTALVAGVMTILMGVVANFPLALATGLGLNAFVTFGIAKLPQMTWPDAMGLIVIEGIVILILVMTGFRQAVFEAVPAQLKIAI